MIYTKQTVKAMNLAYKVHHGQFDKGGVPYIFHPIHVAENMCTETHTIVAMLHDVMEDGNIQREDLINDGYSRIEIRAIEALTRREDETYDEYIKRIKLNPIARNVKIEDLKHNMDRTRLCDEESKYTDRRMKKYRAALDYLMDN